MKKKVLAVVLCLAMTTAMFVGCGSKPAADNKANTEASSESKLPSKDEVTFDVEAEFDANTDYDKFTVFEYTIESAGATFPVTLSANTDETKFEIHCNFYGDEQLVKVEKSGDEFKVVEDKTGFMETDSPAICQAGIDAKNWAATK